MKHVGGHSFGAGERQEHWRKNTRTVLLLLPIFLNIVLVSAGICAAPSRLTVGAATNFAPVLEVVSSLFTDITGIPVQVTVSSSGRLYAQIRNRAPFDLFFSADGQRPELLYQDGYCERPVEYVRGSVVFWSRNPELCRKADSWQDALGEVELEKIGMANPELAPYGAAARAALVEANLMSAVREQLIFGTNVAQSFQYAATGATAGSFISLSLARTPRGEQGCTLSIPEAEPVVQKACVTAASRNAKAARKFLDFMLSQNVKKILSASGYLVPDN